MYKAFKYRIYPTEEQEELINKTIGCCRFVYNLALETKIEVYKRQSINLSSFDLCYQLRGLKEECPWLTEVDSQAVQNSVKTVDLAFKKFFKGSGYPKFKSKRSKQSFTCPNNKREVDFENDTISVPKIHKIKAKLSRKFEGKIKSITITKTPTNKYFASVLVELDIKLPAPPKAEINNSIGIDVGIKTFVTCSDGIVFENPKYLKEKLNRLKCLQRRASRKQKGSNNRKKANLKVALQYEKITNQRLDYIHKVTSELTSDNQAISSIFIEDLNVAGMLKNHKLAQALSDVSLGKFYEILKYKCEWSGINLVKIDRFDPSSKRCSHCGEIKKELKLSERTYDCEHCHHSEDRDLNAAKNILWYGLTNISNKNSPEGVREEPVELSTLVGAEKQEF